MLGLEPEVKKHGVRMGGKAISSRKKQKKRETSRKMEKSRYTGRFAVEKNQLSGNFFGKWPKSWCDFDNLMRFLII
jgi:hypothetical protein